MQINPYYRFGRAAIRAYSFLFFRMRVHWDAPLPRGPKLIAANHPSCIDAFIMPLLAAEQVSIMISGRAFTVPMFKQFLQRADQIPVVAGSGQEAFDEARSRLEAGQSVVIFPEGETSPQEGGERPARPGAAKLAMLTGAPVVPVGIHYPRERSVYISSKITGGQRSGGYWYLSGPYHMTIGEAVQYSGDASDREQVAAVSARLMEQIAHAARQSCLRMEQQVRLGSSVPAV